MRTSLLADSADVEHVMRHALDVKASANGGIAKIALNIAVGCCCLGGNDDEFG